MTLADTKAPRPAGDGAVPTEYEIKILHLLNGEQVDDLIAGAAMWEAVEWLRGAGYVTRQCRAFGLNYALTDKGRALIKGVKA